MKSKFKVLSHQKWITQRLENLHQLENNRNDVANKMIDVYSLAEILSLLPDSSRLDIALNHQDKIENISHLTELLPLLPDAFRPNFALSYQDMIQNDYEFEMVLRCMNEQNKMEYRELYHTNHGSLK